MEWPGWAKLQPTQEDKDKADRTDPDIQLEIQIESDLNTLSNYTRFVQLFKNEIPDNIRECQQRIIKSFQLLKGPYQRNLRKRKPPSSGLSSPTTPKHKK